MAQKRIASVGELASLFGATGQHAIIEFVRVAFGGLLAKRLETSLLCIVVAGTQRVILEKSRSERALIPYRQCQRQERKADLVLLQ